MTSISEMLVQPAGQGILDRHLRRLEPRRVDPVAVCVVEARQQHPTAQVHHLRAGRCCGHDLRLRPDGDDRVALDRDGRGVRLLRIHGQDRAAAEHDVDCAGWRRSRARRRRLRWRVRRRRAGVEHGTRRHGGGTAKELATRDPVEQGHPSVNDVGTACRRSWHAVCGGYRIVQRPFGNDLHVNVKVVVSLAGCPRRPSRPPPCPPSSGSRMSPPRPA